MDLKYLKHVVIYFLSAVLSVIMIYYVCYHLFDGFAQTITTVVCEKVTQSRVMTLDGYLLRQERYLYSSIGGEVGYLYPDGEKLASGVEAVHVYAVKNPEIRDRLIELDEEIALYQASNAVSGITASDTTMIDREIASLYQVLKLALNRGDAEYTYRKQNELLILLNQRKIITRAVDSYDDKILALQAEKDGLTASLSEVSATIPTPASGRFYSKFDGYEEIFSSSCLDTLTVGRFREMMDKPPALTDERTEQGYVVGKLVTDYKWYVACMVSSEEVRQFELGKKYTLLFPYNGDVAITMTLSQRIHDMDAGEAVLVFETGEQPEGFHYLRMQSVQVVQTDFEGYRVPISAVRLVNGVQGVYVMNGNYVRFRAIEPLYEDGGYLIVAADKEEEREDGILWLTRYENIITEGKDLYDGKIIK